MENKWLDSVVEAYNEYFGATEGYVRTVMDIGTRDGDDAEFLREKLGLTPQQVFAIDANPVAFANTRRKYPDFNLTKCAVSNYNGTTKFVRLTGDKDMEGTSSMDVGKASDPYLAPHADILEIPVYTMATLIEDWGAEDQLWAAVKIDVESYTLEVLEGFGEFVTNVQVFHLETERAYPGREDHKNNIEVAKFMREHGFFLVDVSYEWGDNIQDQVWVNLDLADHEPTVKELDETK